MTDAVIEGGCQCGQVRFSIIGETRGTAICHCTSCRKAHSAPAVAWAMFKKSEVQISGSSFQKYASSAEAQRGFCSACGTQISFEAAYMSGLIDIAVCSLDEPEPFAPSLHLWHSEHIPWAEFADNLPRHSETPTKLRTEK